MTSLLLTSPSMTSSLPMISSNFDLRTKNPGSAPAFNTKLLSIWAIHNFILVSSSVPCNHYELILIYMMVLCTQVNKMYVIATLSVYPHRASLKNMPGHGGIRTYDLWNASPMLCQLSYAVRSVRVYDISELSLVPSIPM